MRTLELYLGLCVEFVSLPVFVCYSREGEGESREGSEPLSTTVTAEPIKNSPSGFVCRDAQIAGSILGEASYVSKARFETCGPDIG